MGARLAGDSDRFAQRLFTPLPQRYDMLAELLSMGQNRRWRRAMIDRIVPADAKSVLDVACGPAGVSLQLADRTDAQIVGIDLTEDMLIQGKHNVDLAGMGDRIHLVIGRGQQLPFADSQFDALTFTYLLRYVDDPQSALNEMARVIKPGGTAASLEFFLPPSRFWRFWWWGFTRIVLPIAGWVTGGRAWFVVGRFLGPSISNHYRRYPLSWTIDAWQQAGFEDIGTQIMSLGGGLVMWGTRSNG
ncbi:MAG TPA: class I SAM-dependent methyltransferase [Acidimicrobiales bacterium]|nr:class I SAM-dependent methyltransferase [Acidimicrobiales bacterium]